MGNKQQVTLKNKNTMLDDIQRFLLNKKHILLITSTPSISTTIKNACNTEKVYEITGANNNEFKLIVEHMKNRNVDVLIMGIEQLLNENKREIIIELYNYADIVMVDNIHHLSKTNFDYRPEYENIQYMLQTFITSQCFLYAYALSKEDIHVLSLNFPYLLNSFSEPEIFYSYYSNLDEQRLASIVFLATNYSVVCITHDYLFAEIFANQLHRFVSSGAIHRKVEETKKVKTTLTWQSSLLTSLVITSDTILPYPYPHVDHVIWLDMPVSKQQVSFYHQLFIATKSLLVFNKESYTPNNVFVHQFAYNNLLNEVVQSIKNNPSGLTMREIEHFIDGESYVLEKAMKGLKAYQALKKEKLVYVLDQTFQLTNTMINNHQAMKENDFRSLFDTLHQKDDIDAKITPEITQTMYHYALSVFPKILFPIGFYNSSLIKKEHQSDAGYVFYKSYMNIDDRAQAIKGILDHLNISNTDISITCLCDENDSIETLMKYYARKHGVPFFKMFSSFRSDLLKNYFNPYHKMTCIMSQFKLIRKTELNDITIVFADHGDHFWQMGVVAKALLEEKLTKRVIVVFNQP